MDLEVSNQDTVSGVAVVALSNELQALADQGDGGEPTDAFSEIDGVSVSEFDDGSFVGQQYEFSNVPIDQLALNDDSSTLQIRRDGDNLVVSGNLSLEDEAAADESAEDFGFGQAFFDSADLRVSIKFPGEILETNGEVDEETNTINWTPKYGESNELSATVYAPRGIPAWIWWVIGGSAAGIAFVGLGVFLFRKKGEWEPEEFADVPAPNLGQTLGAQEGFSRSDRPVFSYSVRSSPFAREHFELRVYENELSYGFFTKGGKPSSELVTIQTSQIDDVARIEDSSALGVRLVHSGKVEILPAKAKESHELVALLRSLSKAGDRHSTRPMETLSETPSTSGPSSPSAGLVDELRQLHSLLQEGVLSPEEFEELKRKRIERE
jgi:hypothetical protein